jgi:hypothetical protein
MTQSRVREK